MTRPALVLAAPVRTPIGKFGGALAALSAVDLGAAAARAGLERAAPQLQERGLACLVLASSGYPRSPAKAEPISGLDAAHSIF